MTNQHTSLSVGRSGELLALADRCEKASEDETLTILYDAWDTLADHSAAFRRYAIRHVSRFTRLLEGGGYLDAALLLVPEECLFTARTVWDNERTASLGFISRYESKKPHGMLLRYWVDEHQSIAVTPALALTAAALRAQATNNTISEKATPTPHKERSE